MLLSYCAGDGILLLFYILHIFCYKAEFFPLVWKTLARYSFVSGEGDLGNFICL